MFPPFFLRVDFPSIARTKEGEKKREGIALLLFSLTRGGRGEFFCRGLDGMEFATFYQFPMPSLAFPAVSQRRAQKCLSISANPFLRPEMKGKGEIKGRRREEREETKKVVHSQKKRGEKRNKANFSCFLFPFERK